MLRMLRISVRRLLRMVVRMVMRIGVRIMLRMRVTVIMPRCIVWPIVFARAAKADWELHSIGVHSHAQCRYKEGPEWHVVGDLAGRGGRLH